MRAFIFSAMALLLPFSASADWTAFLPASTPPHFFAVDKEKDMLYRVAGAPKERAVIKECPTIHGRVEGDKMAEGDMKTPEGVYFITHKITEMLDFMDYGPHAFGLNYPNPADLIREKTGSGIWLHSKGRPIKEVRTRGCVAIEQADINELVPVLTPGTPVVIAQRQADPFFSGLDAEISENAGKPADQPKASPSPAAQGEAGGQAQMQQGAPATPPAAGPQGQQAAAEKAEAAPADFAEGERKVLALSAEWRKLFYEATGELFGLYDRKRWKKATREDFSALEKRRIGEMPGEKPGAAEEIGVLSGPGYWASFFARKIQRNGADVQGTQILYWMPDEEGQMRVIGDYWVEGAAMEAAKPAEGSAGK